MSTTTTPVRSEPGWLTTADKIVGVFVRIGGSVSAIVIFVLMIHICLDVGLRYTMNSPLPATIEIVSFWWMVLVTFPAQGMTQRRNEHLEVTLLTDLMPTRDRYFAWITGKVLSIITCAALAYYGLLSALEQTQRGEIAMGSITIPVWPMRWVVPIGFSIWLLQLFIDLIRDLRAVRNETRAK